jgi:Holliday junction resolvase RusA-like endonuclease
MIQTFTIPGRLPGYNELKAHFMKSARVKGEAMDTIGWAAKAARVLPFSGPVMVTIHCFEPNAKRDPDNVTSGAAKCVLDALQNIGVLKNDNRKHVTPRLPKPEVDRANPRVEVSIQDIGGNPDV